MEATGKIIAVMLARGTSQRRQCLDDSVYVLEVRMYPKKMVFEVFMRTKSRV